MAACSPLRRSLGLSVAVIATIFARAAGLLAGKAAGDRASLAAPLFHVACDGPPSYHRQEPAKLLEIPEEWDCNYIKNKSAQRYIMLGAFDSGTNLLHQAMYGSWPETVCLSNSYDVWKHSATGVDDIYKFLLTTLGSETMSKTVVLHTLRSPIAQLSSWIKAPYDLRGCVHRNVTRWNKPCFAKMGPDENNHPHSNATRFANTMAAYIQYVKQFEEFSRQGWFKAVVGVPYEDMILTPGKMMKHIAKHFDNLQVPENVITELETPAKKDFCLGYDAAVSKLRTRSYLKGFTEDGLRVMCDGLVHDKALLEGHFEGNFLEPRRQVSYWHDCRDRSESESASFATSFAQSSLFVDRGSAGSVDVERKEL